MVAVDVVRHLDLEVFGVEEQGMVFNLIFIFIRRLRGSKIVYWNHRFDRFSISRLSYPHVILHNPFFLNFIFIFCILFFFLMEKPKKGKKDNETRYVAMKGLFRIAFSYLL